MKPVNWIILLLIGTVLLGCGVKKQEKTDYSLVLKDSLYWEKKSVDSLIKIPTSYAPLVILPDKMDVGETKEKKEGQATVKVEKQPDGSLLVSATCDSLELHINYLQERLMKISSQNEQLQQEIKESPQRLNWFSIGFGCACILFILIVILIYKFKK